LVLLELRVLGVILHQDFLDFVIIDRIFNELGLLDGV